MPTTVARLQAVIGVDLDPLKKGTDEAKKLLNNTAEEAKSAGQKIAESFNKLDHQKIQGVGTGLTVGVTLPLLAAGGAAIKMASSANEAANKVKVVFGDSAKIVQDFAEKSATSFGQSGGEALAAAGTFGNLFKTIGLGQKPAADMSVSLLKLAADLSSFNDIPVDEALEKLRAGLVGEAEPLRALGVLLNESTVEAKALAMGLEQVDGKFTEGAKVQARYALIMEQTKTAQGDYARTSGDLANASRNLGAEFKQLGEDLGKELLPVAKDAVGVGLAMVKGFAALPDPLQKSVIWVGALAAAAGPLVFTFGKLVEIVKGGQAIWIAATAAKVAHTAATTANAAATAAETTAIGANTLALNANAAAAGRASFAHNLLSKIPGGAYGLGRGIGMVAGPLAALTIPHAIAHSMGVNPPGPGDAFKPLANDIARRFGWLPKAAGGSTSIADLRMRDDTNTSPSLMGSSGPNQKPFPGNVIPALGVGPEGLPVPSDRRLTRPGLPTMFGQVGPWNTSLLPPALRLYGQGGGGGSSVQFVQNGPRIPTLPDWMRTGPAGVMGGDMFGPGGVPFYRPTLPQAQLPQVPAAPGVQQLVINVQPGASIPEILQIIQRALETKSRALEYGPQY